MALVCPLLDVRNARAVVEHAGDVCSLFGYASDPSGEGYLLFARVRPLLEKRRQELFDGDWT